MCLAKSDPDAGWQHRASIFGEPCHQLWEGSSECWISRDGGKLWSFLSVPAHHEPSRTRGDLAAGLTHEGAYVVLCSGRKFVPPPGELLDRERTENEKGNQEAKNIWNQSTYSFPMHNAYSFASGPQPGTGDQGSLSMNFK